MRACPVFAGGYINMKVIIPPKELNLNAYETKTLSP
jgi:hypothetical protein